MLKEKIEEHLAPLVGLPLSSVARVVDLATFGFGRLIERQGRRPGRVPEFRLHIQETWRVTHGGEVLLGYGDWHYPPRGSAIGYDDFVEQDEDRNHRDDLADDWLAHGVDAHVVVECRGTEAGDLSISFADGCLLETFANQASRGGNGDDEFWRLLSPDPTGDRPHFVVTARGLM
jgi:hypothetical protein